jgi:hypothetical protein
VRILHATDTYGPTVGGIEVLVSTLAHRQAAAGDQVTVVTRTPGPHDSHGTVEVCRDPCSLASLVARADVVHGHVSAYSPLAIRAVEAGATVGVPSVATVHSVWGSAWPLFRGAAAVRGWTTLPIQWAAVSEVAAHSVRRAMPDQDVLVIPNGVDAPFWAPADPARRGGHVTIVSVMRMTRRKRPLELVAVLQRLRARLPRGIGVDVVLAGDRQGTGITEFMTPGVEGLLAASDDQLADHLADLCIDAALRARMVRHNHLVPPRLDWSYVHELNAAAYALAGTGAAVPAGHLTSLVPAPGRPLRRGDGTPRARQPEGNGSPAAAGWPLVPGGTLPPGTNTPTHV